MDSVSLCYDDCGERTGVRLDNNRSALELNMTVAFMEERLAPSPTPSPPRWGRGRRGRVPEIADARQGIMRFHYDPNGNLLSVSDTKNQTTTYTYDNMDRLATRKDALNRQESYLYGPAGNLTQFTDRKNQQSTFTHDVLNRRIGASSFGGSTTSFTHDSVRRLAAATDSASGTIQVHLRQSGPSKPRDHATRHGGLSVRCAWPPLHYDGQWPASSGLSV